MITNGSFHHIGIACRDLRRDALVYAMLGYALEGEGFDDPVLGVRGAFLKGVGPRLELVSDRPGAAVVAPWLERGVSMYHLAFVVPDLPRAIEEARSGGAKLVTGPVPAVAFGSREVAFVVLRNRALVELIAAA